MLVTSRRRLRRGRRWSCSQRVNTSPDILQQALAEAYPQWRSWLRFRYPTLASHHPDFIQDAAADLTEYVRAGRPERFTHSDLSRIGFAILKRRVVDHFRAATSRWADRVAAVNSSDRASDPDPAEPATYAQVLPLVVAYVARLSATDRDLLIRHSDAIEHRNPMTGAERQRLSRLREQLRDYMQREHRINIRQFLEED
jgi:hypothetical protein